MLSIIQNITSVLNPIEPKKIGEGFSKKHHDKSYISKDHPENEDQAMSEKDYEIFSITSIIKFLEDFIESRLGSKSFDNNNIEQSQIAPWLKTTQSNDQKIATKAYAHAAKTLHRTLTKQKTNMMLSCVPFLFLQHSFSDDCISSTSFMTKKTSLLSIFPRL